MDPEILAQISEIFRQAVFESYSQRRAIRSYDGRQKTIGGSKVFGNAIATGKLANSYTAEWITPIDGGQPQLEISPPLGSEEWYYAYFVENGRLPSIGRMPPLNKISKWAQAKYQAGGLFWRNEKGKFTKAPSPLQRVFAYAKSIEKYGFAGYPFIDKAIDIALPRIIEQLGDEAAQYFQNQINNIPSQ